MPLVEIKKLYLLAHNEEREAILELLQRLGSVELVDLQESPEWAEIRVLLEPGQAGGAVSRLEAYLGEVRYCLDFVQRYFPIRKNFIQQFTGSRLELSAQEYSDYIASARESEAVYGACRKAEEDLTRIRNEETRYRSLLAELKPWIGFSLPLEEVIKSNCVSMDLVTIPLESYPALIESLKADAPDFYLEEFSTDKDLAYCLLIYMTDDSAVVSSLFKNAAANPVDFSHLTGTAADATLSVEQRLSALEQERSAVLAKVEALLEQRPLLMACFDYLDNERAKLEAFSNLACTQSSFLLKGWVPLPDLDELEKELRAQAETAVLVIRDPDENEAVPVLMANRGPVAAYEVVTRLYSVPRRDELDPTPFMAPFFFVFFGICMADVGYGIILSLLAFFISRKLKLAGMGKQLVDLLFWGGIASVVFGIVFGGYLGDFFGLAPLWFNPLEDPITMLIFCFSAGLFHIYFGMGIQAYRSIKAGKLLDALRDQGRWLVFLSSLILIALPQFSTPAKWVVIACAVLLVLTQGRKQKGLLKKFFSGLGSLYNITGYLSDVLSYSRLLALSLSTAVIATVINVMGKLMAGSLLGYLFMAIILTGGHFFNMLIGVLGAYVHTSRLQYIEFFGKFFEGGGRPFRPFRLTHKYIDVLKWNRGQ